MIISIRKRYYCRYFVKISFADHLKKCVELIFNFSNDQMYSSKKDIIDERYHKTPRELLQWFGTDIMRKQFDNNFFYKMIIGITGRSQSGKDTITDILVKKYNFVKISFADHLKKCVELIFNFSNDQMYSSKKDIIDERYHKTPRELLQWFGTDIMRKQFDNNFWINQMKLDMKTNIVISDIRFKNEAEFIKKNNGVIIKVERKSIPILNHESENQIIDFDYMILNNHGFEELECIVDDLYMLLVNNQKSQKI